MYTQTYLHTINIVCIAECSLQLYLCPCKIESNYFHTVTQEAKERKKESCNVHLMIYTHIILLHFKI